MRAQPQPGLRPWLVDLGNNSYVIFEGVEPPTFEWVARMKNFRKKVLDPIHELVMKELDAEARALVV